MTSRPLSVARAGWAELYRWQIDRNAEAPIYRQIYLQIRSAILSRTFPPGTKLPSTRELAQRLSVARASIVAAYEQLLAEGFVSGTVGSGTYISSDLPEAIEPRRPASLAKKPPIIAGTRQPARPNGALVEFVDAASGSPDRPFNTARMLVDARTVEVWRKLSNHAMRAFSASHLAYTDPCGSMELRTAISDYVRAARAVRCEPGQIIVTAGSQQSLDIAIRVLLRPGDDVVVEDPGYPLTHHALIAAGVQLHPIAVDAEGMNVGQAIRVAPRAAAAVVTPSLQYPTGVVLSMARRLELLDWSRQHGGWIIEDDWASEYRYAGRPLASLQGLDDGERVIYFGTLNKTLFPGLRIGYAVVPPRLVKAFATARYLMDRQPPSLQQEVLAEFMRQGHLAAHIRRTRLMYHRQRDALMQELEQRLGTRLAIETPDQGMHLVAYLRDGLSDIAIEKAARESGVVVRAMSPMYTKARPRSALMLGFSGYSPQRLVSATTRLAAAIERQPAKRGRSR
jgi:GntR family transcriptional regulator / MocR family aminotransferase